MSRRDLKNIYIFCTQGSIFPFPFNTIVCLDHGIRNLEGLSNLFLLFTLPAYSAFQCELNFLKMAHLVSLTLWSPLFPTKFPPSTLKAKILSVHSNSSIDPCPLVSLLRGQQAHCHASLISGLASGLSKLRNQSSGSFMSICFSLLLTVVNG